MSTGTIGGYYANQGAVSGGASDLVGTHLMTYGGSDYESAHVKLIRSLARELKNNLKIKGVNPDESDLGKLCRSLVSSVPKKGIKNEMQKLYTSRFAQALNKVYGSQILDPKQDSDVLCAQILELLSSLCDGLSGEFSAVKSEVKRIVKNLQDLRMLLERNNKTLMAKVEDSDDQTLKSQTNSIKTVHQLLVSENDRQLALLQNMFKTIIEPTDVSVSEILNKNKDLKHLIKRVGSPGNDSYSHKLMAGLAGAGNVAMLAHDVKRALSKIGMSMADYEKAKDIKELEAAASKLMESKLDLKHPKLTEIGEFLGAVDVLRQADYHRKDVAKAIKGGAVTGGRYKGLDKRIQKRRKLRNNVFRGYNAELSQVFNSMIDQLERMSKQLGRTIVITEPLEAMVSALTNIPDIGKKHIYYSLSGYIDDTRAKARREFFMNQLYYCVFTIDRLLKMSSYKDHSSVLESLRDSIKQVLDLVKKFENYFSSGWKIAAMDAKKTGALEITASQLKRGRGQGEALQQEQANQSFGDVTQQQQDLFMNGMSQSDVQGGALDDTPLPEVTTAAYRLREVLDQLRYYFDLAKARYNMAKAAHEVEEAAEDYTQILGDGIGKKLEAITQHHLGTDSNSIKSRIEAGLKAKTFNDKEAAALQSFNEDVFKAKRGMFRVAEAIEVYLIAFSDAISKHPEEIKSLQAALNSVNLTASWYSNKSGDNLCDVFDSFPESLDAAGAPQPTKVKDQTGAHYYQKIESAIGKFAVGALPGIPFLPINITDAAAAKKKADKAVRSLLVLKNLVSAFISIGSKFANEDLRKKTHMTTKQIYDGLAEYLWISAFVNDITNKNTAAAPQYSAVVPQSNLAGTMNAGRSKTGSDSLVVGLNTFGAPLAAADEFFKAVTMDGYLGKGEEKLRANATFDETDRLFVMVLKCLVSKPLTVVGIFNMHNRPEYRVRSMDPARMVLGGSDHPKIESDLVPLYVRLPLLAEFYREVFNFEGFTGDAISMVPEADGLFSGFVELMFNQTRHVQRGFYSESQVKAIIEEVNRIYARFGSKKDTVITDIFNEFVADVNRRYGIVATSDRESYNKERRLLHGNDRDLNIEPLDEDYPILEGEDDPNIRMPAPSDAYFGISTRNYQTDAELDLNEKQIVNQFRRKIDGLLYNQEVSGKDNRFNNAIYQAQQELSSLNSDSERFDVVMNAVQGVGRFLRHGGVKAIMFSEAVVAPLNLLGAIYSQLVAYREQVEEWDLAGLQKDLVDWLSSFDGTVPVATARTAFSTHITSTLDNARVRDGLKTFNSCFSAFTTAFLGNVGMTANQFTGCTGDFSALNGMSASEFANEEPNARVADFLRDLMSKAELKDIFQSMHQALFSQDTDLNKMVRVRVVDSEQKEGTLVIDHANLKNHVEKLFVSTKELLDKFRGSISAEDMTRFERGDHGSLYYLEEKLLEEIIKGVEPDETKPISLDQVDSAVTDTIDLLKKCSNYAGVNFGNEYNVEIYGFKDLGVQGFFPGPGVAGATLSPSGVLSVLGGAVAPMTKPSFIQPTVADGIYNQESYYFKERSLYYLFNELLFKYLNLCYDPAAQKIYRKCLDNIAGGIFSDSVSDPAANSFNDIDGQYFTNVAPDMDRRVITMTNAHIMRVLINSTVQAKPAYLIQEMSDVPSHMKDRYRANFPFLIKNTDTLIRRCELVKALMLSGLRSDGTETMQVKVVNRIAQGLFALRNSAADVMKELDDQAKFMEISRDAIDNHRSLFGQLPVMPLSSLLTLCRNIDSTPNTEDPYQNNLQLPFSTQGTLGFKFRYGTRQLLGRPGSQVSLDHMPWMKEMLQSYNGISESRTQIENDPFSSHVQTFVDLMRYYADARHIRNKMYDDKLSLSAKFPAMGVAGSGNFGIRAQDAEGKALAVYALQSNTTFSDILAMTESTSVDSKRTLLAQAVTAATISSDRKDVVVRNLIDMNIVPINVRALMREVVLINIYNYSYTWDQMVLDMFKYHPRSVLADDTAAVSSGDLLNPRDVFVRLLIDPYQPLDMATYYNNVPLIMSGLMGLGLGSPKFLGDQFYNKALLGELYPNMESYIRYNGQMTQHVQRQQNLGYGLGPANARAANQARSQAVSRMNLPALVAVIYPGSAADQSQVVSMVNNLRRTRPSSSPELLAAVGITPPLSPSDARLAMAALVIYDITNEFYNNRMSVRELAVMGNDLKTALDADYSARVVGGTLKDVFTVAKLSRTYSLEKYADVLTLSTPLGGAGVFVSPNLATVQSALLRAFPVASSSGNMLPLTQMFGGEYLLYMKDSAKDFADRVAEVTVGTKYRQALKVVGKARFDTKLARNLTFIVMCQRVLRMKLHSELSWNRKIINGSTIVDPKFTENFADKNSFNPDQAAANGRYIL